MTSTAPAYDTPAYDTPAYDTPAYDTPAYDTIVVGLGAMGSATLLQLARRGQRVLGIDRYDPPHTLGSTHGDTRITRCAIGEGEAYVPLVRRSHELWREIEAETGTQLLTQCGALILAPRTNAGLFHGKPGFLPSTIAAADRFAIPHELLDADETMRRFPQFRLRGDEIVYFEPGGGYLSPERCVTAQLTLARRAGATIRTGTQVTSITRDGNGAGAGVRVATAAGDSFRAAEAVLAAGAWSPGLVGGALARHMTVTRQVLLWFAPNDPAAFAPERCPVWIWVHGDGLEDTFYGFPILPGSTDGVKAATEQYATALPDPDQVARTVTPAEAAETYRTHLAERVPGLTPRLLRTGTCLYTATPDGDFLLARAPENDRILLVSACSGHGFKHSAALGEAVAAVVTGQGSAGLDGFAAARPTLAGR